VKQYLVTEDDVQTIARLADAAKLLSVGLPSSYTVTPLGALATVVKEVDRVIFTKLIHPHTCTEDS
jgi:hypothetical protein